MTLRLSKPFLRQYRKLPAPIRIKVDRQLHHLATNLHHPGLNAKKMVGHDSIWEARVDVHYRLTFQVEGEIMTLRRVGTHQIYRQP